MKTILALLLTLSFSSGTVWAQDTELTDEQALAEGMTPLDSLWMKDLQYILDGGTTAGTLEEAIKTHRFVIAINKSAIGPDAQTLTIYENGVETFKDKISTGREKKEKAKSGRIYISTTPTGYYRPTMVYRDYMSNTWKAPMPNAVFFIGGIAIHATTESHYEELGTRASGGCVRTKLEVSQMIREKVMESGKGSGPESFKIVTESKGRNRIMNNTISVPRISRQSGQIVNGTLNSWDTVIVVHED